MTEGDGVYGLMENLNQILNQSAMELTRVSLKNNETMALIGYALGVIFSLKKALEYGYSDRTGERISENYADELILTAKNLSEDKVINSRDWVSGYYFNSGLQRLAALNERATKLAFGNKRDITETIRKEVNRLKHHIDGVVSGRDVNLKNTVYACLTMCKFLKTHNKQL